MLIFACQIALLGLLSAAFIQVNDRHGNAVDSSTSNVGDRTDKTFLKEQNIVSGCRANEPQRATAVAIAMRGRMRMNKPHRRTNFTPSDDALILEQPVTRIGLKTLATMLHTSHETLMRRADELGVSLAISHDEAVDTRALRRSDGLVDPLLERLKRAHGDRK